MRPAVWLSGGSCGRSRAFPQGLPGGRSCDRRCATACGQTAGRRFIRPRAGMCFRMRDRLNTAQSKGHFPKAVSFPPGVAAFGAVLVVCGVSQPLSGTDLPLIFAPKRQGKAESAYRRPRLRPSFGQQKGIGQPMPYKMVMAGLSPIRRVRIFVSSKVCFELPETLRVTPASLAPERGRGFLSEVGKPVSTCGAYAGSYAHAVTPLNP